MVGLGTCEIIALHHSGLPRTDDQNRILTKAGTIAQPGTPDEEIDWLGNEGIKVSKIIDALQNASLPQQMESRRNELLRKTKVVAGQLSASPKETEQPVTAPSTIIDSPAPKPVAPNTAVSFNTTVPANTTVSPNTNSSNMARTASSTTDFLITAANKPEIIQRIEAMLSNRYNQPVKLALAMPSLAEEGSIELFSFSVSITGNVNEEALNLVKIPEVLNAEVDFPLRLNADTNFVTTDKRAVATESGALIDDGLGRWDEDEFLSDYANSPYVEVNNLQRCRKWNWQATGFDNLLKIAGIPSPRKEGIRIVQFDTGYTDHFKGFGRVRP